MPFGLFPRQLIQLKLKLQVFPPLQAFQHLRDFKLQVFPRKAFQHLRDFKLQVYPALSAFQDLRHFKMKVFTDL